MFDLEGHSHKSHRGDKRFTFINALRRFVSLRGPLKKMRSDRGTDFLGALDTIPADAVYKEKEPIRDYLRKNRIIWIFNTSHASQRG